MCDARNGKTLHRLVPQQRPYMFPFMHREFSLCKAGRPGLKVSHVQKHSGAQFRSAVRVWNVCCVVLGGRAVCRAYIWQACTPPMLLYSSPLWPHSAVSDAARATSCADLAHCINHTVAQSCARPHPMVRQIPAGDGATAAMHESRAAHSGGPACGCA